LEGYFLRYAHVGSGLIAFLMVATAFCALPAARAEVDIGIGDYWEYDFSSSMDDFGLIMDGSYKLSIESETTLDAQEIFALDVSGFGDVSGTFGDVSLSESFDITGFQKRVKADFNLVAEEIQMKIDMGSMMGIPLDINFSFLKEYDQPMDDYIGNDDLAVDTVVTSSSDVTVTSSVNSFGMNESDSLTTAQTLTMTVVEENVSVEVPAGTFDCYKVMVELDTDGFVDTRYWYYSEEVQSYVKMSATPFGAVADFELVDYSNKDDGVFGLFTGDNLWITLLIIVVVVIVVAVAFATKSRRGKTPTAPPQPGPIAPPPATDQSPVPPTDPTPPPPPGHPPSG